MADKKTKAIIRADNLHKKYKTGPVEQHVLRGVNLRVAAGEFVAIMGASGSGKSTLLHILGLLDRPNKGEVIFENEPVSSFGQSRQNKIRNRSIGFVFQFYHLLPELSVQENIMMPLMIESSVLGWMGRKKQAQQRVSQLISELGLQKQARHRPATLSGGERQKTALARALVQNPKLLLADEPTGNLDSASGQNIMNLLKKLNQKGQTIIMVTHDPNIAGMADRCVHLQDGLVK